MFWSGQSQAGNQSDLFSPKNDYQPPSSLPPPFNYSTSQPPVPPGKVSTLILYQLDFFLWSIYWEVNNYSEGQSYYFKKQDLDQEKRKVKDLPFFFYAFSRLCLLKVRIRQVIGGTGIISTILNENFAIIQFKTGNGNMR